MHYLPTRTLPQYVPFTLGVIFDTLLTLLSLLYQYPTLDIHIHNNHHYRDLKSLSEISEYTGNSLDGLIFEQMLATFSV